MHRFDAPTPTGRPDAAMPSHAAVPRLRLRWLPRYAVADGRLVGAEAHAAGHPHPERPHPEPRPSLGRLAARRAMSLADDLLRAGCPVPLTVRLSAADLDDRDLSSEIGAWSSGHGGAERLLAVEFDVADLRRRPAQIDTFAAELRPVGCALAIGGLTAPDPMVTRLGRPPLAYAADLGRRAETDPLIFRRLRHLAENAMRRRHSAVITGVCDLRVVTALKRAGFDGAWQFDETIRAFGDDELLVHALAHRAAPRSRRDAAADGGRDDVTWVERAPAGSV